MCKSLLYKCNSVIVLKYPASTRNSVTPKNPPCNIAGLRWNATIPMIAKARNPSIAGFLFEEL